MASENNKKHAICAEIHMVHTQLGGRDTAQHTIDVSKFSKTGRVYNSVHSLFKVLCIYWTSGFSFLPTQDGAEIRERRVAHQRHQMSSERGYQIYK